MSLRNKPVGAQSGSRPAAAPLQARNQPPRRAARRSRASLPPVMNPALARRNAAGAAPAARRPGSLRTREMSEAIEAYKRCVAADATFCDRHSSLGCSISTWALRRSPSGIVRGVRYDPKYADAYNNLGFLLRRLQRNLEASPRITIPGT